MSFCGGPIKTAMPGFRGLVDRNTAVTLNLRGPDTRWLNGQGQVGTLSTVPGTGLIDPLPHQEDFRLAG